MKKKNIIILIFVLLLGLSSTSIYNLYYEKIKYKNWRNVNIKNYGQIKIPNEWVVTWKDNELYLSNKKLNEKNAEVYFIQTNVIYDEDITERKFYNSIYKNFRELKSLSGEMLSNSAIYEKILLDINTKNEEKYIIFLHPSAEIDEDFVLLSISDKIKNEDVIKISKSYILD